MEVVSNDLNITCIILCAGQSNRMGYNKLTTKLLSKTPIRLCAEAFLACKHTFSFIFAASESNTVIEIQKTCTDLCIKPVISKGGVTRTESVKNALEVISKCDVVVIHDAARCMVSPRLIDESISAAIQYGSGITALKVNDTLRNKLTHECINRNDFLQMQTPQTFDFAVIKSAYLQCDCTDATDDCEIYVRYGGIPHYVEGSPTNQKLTYPEDAEMFTHMLNTQSIGYGEDTHALVEGRKLILGGVEIPYCKGLLGHSDADVLVHAIIDALLGGACLGDIGKSFPDTDEKYKGISSLYLLERVGELLRLHGFFVSNIDATIIAQSPKLAKCIDDMRYNVSKALKADASVISVKATTTEYMNDEGKQLCITARSVAMLNRRLNK